MKFSSCDICKKKKSNFAQILKCDKNKKTKKFLFYDLSNNKFIREDKNNTALSGI